MLRLWFLLLATAVGACAANPPVSTPEPPPSDVRTPEPVRTPPEPPIEFMRFGPRMQFGPRVHFRILIRIPKDPSNREFCVEIPDVRRTCQTLDEYSQQVYEWIWKDLVHPGGEGEVWAVLAQGHPNYKEYRVREPFTVMTPED